jgi:TonB family protein
MKIYVKAFKVLLTLSLLQASFGQGPIRVSSEEAGRHLTNKVDAPYPPMARIARIQGEVIIDLSISETGSVSNVRAISGHPILIQSATDTVRQWRYEPFIRDGKAVPVKASVLVRFSMDDKQSPALAQYYEQEGFCRLDMLPEKVPEAASACIKAAELAEALPLDRLTERLNMNAYAGDALSATGKFKEASQYYQKAIEANEEYDRSAVPKTKWVNPVAIDVYMNSAFALHSAGDLNLADSRYTQAENILERQIKAEQNPRFLNVRVLGTLKQVLERHAALLRQLGRTAAADNLIERANQIKTEAPEPPRK